MIKDLISGLSVSKLKQQKETALEEFKKFKKASPFDGIIRGEEKSGWNGMLHVGLFPDNQGNLEKKYMIHISLEGSTRNSRNVEGNKIENYFIAEKIIQLLPATMQTIQIPKIHGHKITFQHPTKDLFVREVYVDYVPRDLPFPVTHISLETFASNIGRDTARFMYAGMINVPRHVRANFSKGKSNTCMIDMDEYDPRTFYWHFNDLFSKQSYNYKALLEREEIFFQDIADYFFIKKTLGFHEATNESINLLFNVYRISFLKEIKEIKGLDVSNRFKLSKPIF